MFLRRGCVFSAQEIEICFSCNLADITLLLSHVLDLIQNIAVCLCLFSNLPASNQNNTNFSQTCLLQLLHHVTYLLGSQAILYQQRYGSLLIVKDIQHLLQGNLYVSYS